MRHCPNCQSPIDESIQYCDQCGYELAPGPQNLTPSQPAYSAEDSSGTGVLPLGLRTFPIGMTLCSACGYSNMAGEMFCQSCGVQLPPIASVPPPPPIPLSNPLHSDRIAQEDLPEAASQSGLKPDAVDQVSHASGQVAMPPSLPVREGDRVEGKLILPGSDIEFMLPMSRKEVIIGRSDPVKGIYPDVDLAPYEGERRGVSRRHARIEREDRQTYLIDLNSTNYSFLNRMKLQPGQRYPLKDGDEICLGLFVLQYRLA